jgi:SNF2 family DNA or RNA helicase
MTLRKTMSKYTLIKHRDFKNEFDVSTVTVEVEAETIYEIVEEFANFLKASGFSERTVEETLNLNQDK